MFAALSMNIATNTKHAEINSHAGINRHFLTSLIIVHYRTFAVSGEDDHAAVPEGVPGGSVSAWDGRGGDVLGHCGAEAVGLGGTLDPVDGHLAVVVGAHGTQVAHGKGATAVQTDTTHHGLLWTSSFKYLRESIWKCFYKCTLRPLLRNQAREVQIHHFTGII